MVCTLLNTDDPSGIWLFRSLQQRGIKDIRLISIDELLYASHFSCGLQNGKAFFTINLQNGLELTDQNVTAALNRVQHVPLHYINRFTAPDQDYVSQEMKAIFTFFFSILPNPVFNNPSGMGFNGRIRSQSEWNNLAAVAGFDTIEEVYENKRLQQAELSPEGKAQTVLYFNGKCFGSALLSKPLPEEQCLKLGRLSNERILEIYFHSQAGAPLFTGVSLLPTFNGMGNDFFNELIMLL